MPRSKQLEDPFRIIRQLRQFGLHPFTPKLVTPKAQPAQATPVATFKFALRRPGSAGGRTRPV